MTTFLWGFLGVLAFITLGALFAWCASRLGAQADRDRDRALAELDTPKVVPIRPEPYSIVVSSRRRDDGAA